MSPGGAQRSGAAPAGPGNSAPAGCWGQGGGQQHPACARACKSFPLPGSICRAGTRRGSVSHNKRAPRPRRARPAPASRVRARVPAGTAPASPPPGTRKGRGRGDNNPAGKGAERRGAERQDSQGRGFGPCRRVIGGHRPSGRRSLVNAQIRSQGARGGVLAGTAVVPGWSFAKAGGNCCRYADTAGWSRGSASRTLPCPCLQLAAENYTPCPPAHATRAAAGVPGDGEPSSHSGSKEAC